jgi:hypothetical protein
VVMAFAGGDSFVRTHGNEWASLAMATGCVIALASYVRLLVTSRGVR